MTEINKLLWLVGKKENFERIKDLLEMLSINYAVIKGEALSLQAYGKVGQRIYSDIDILVSIKYIILITVLQIMYMVALAIVYQVMMRLQKH